MNKILLTSIAAALCAVPVFAEPQVERSTSSSSSVITTDGKGNGKAIVTIEVNGKKETREIDLGSGNTQIKISTDNGQVATTDTRRVVYLGVSLEDLPPAVAAQLPADAANGVLATSVVPDSPAAAAGLQVNDVIVKVDDQPIGSSKDLKALIAGHKEGDTVHVTYFRRGQKAEAQAKLTTMAVVEPTETKVLGLNGFDNQLQKMLKGLGATLSLDKEIIVVDKDGKVISRERKDASDKIENELARLRDQLAKAQLQAADALKRAEEAARAAAEAAQKSLEK
jgi:hypothetical protein